MNTLLENLRTGKPHVSFSEISCWKECTWRHKLLYIDNVGQQKYTPALAFGHVQHDAIENLVMNGSIDIDTYDAKLTELWEKHCFEDTQPLDDVRRQLRTITTDFKPFIDETFPNWKCIASELPLYETIDEMPHAFKGFIDLVIEVPHKNKNIHWILDLKTTQWGWDRDKKSNKITRYQLIYYKNFLSRKQGIDMKDIRCAFILLKKRGKPGATCELVPVSVGDVTTERAMKTLKNMVSSVNRGIAIKNRDACKWCEFKETEHCR